MHALSNVSLQIEKGQFVSIVGHSGSGKSTLLHMLGGLDSPTSGEVFVDGEDITKMAQQELTLYRRRKVGFVFQSYNLVPLLTVYENIVFPLEIDGKKPDADYINDILQTLGIADKRSATPNMLSGGQQQRVAIARALATKPAILLADEPTGNLDYNTGMDVVNALKQSVSKYNQTLVVITHNKEIAEMAEVTFSLRDGKVVA